MRICREGDRVRKRDTETQKEIDKYNIYTERQRQGDRDKHRQPETERQKITDGQRHIDIKTGTQTRLDPDIFPEIENQSKNDRDINRDTQIERHRDIDREKCIKRDRLPETQTEIEGHKTKD